MPTRQALTGLFSALVLSLLTLPPHAPAAGTSSGWKPADSPIMTRWAKDVSPDNVLPEYPRPQMVRKDWMNLNGLWEYAITGRDEKQPGAGKFDGKILVPFPVESALSGVKKMVGPDKRLWYRRTFTAPKEWGADKRVLLHFGAVDWDTTVFLNGKEVGKHRGGYDPFTFDVTDALTKGGDGKQELVVSVWDPSDAGYQPRGKQVQKPGGIFYTPTTGIWQTVWLEPVDEAYIKSIRIVPDADQGKVRVTVEANRSPSASQLEVMVYDGDQNIASGALHGANPAEITIALRDPKLWSPDRPHLYGLRVRHVGKLAKVHDEVQSYFGLRKISLGKDDQGVNRVMLNGKFLFQYGPLDQGFWPDGLYTAPTDEALKYDIEITKKLGFNMARKHVKVEPARWYYWCDKLGLLVWQDMPSGDRSIGPNDPDITRSKESAENYEREWKAIIDANYNFPCIVMWVPFNEGWGQFDTKRIVDLTKKWDPTRLVDNASGWSDRAGVGDVIDMHNYPGPGSPMPEDTRAAVLGEFGGLGLPVEGHTWLGKDNWGYRTFTDSESLTEAYVGLLSRMHFLVGKPGLSAAVYTQTTDVETEVNGLLTYDRAVMKMDERRITEAAKKLHLPPPQVVTVVPDSRQEGQHWRLTTDKPADGWEKPGFDDSAWQTGYGGFGTEGTPGAVVHREWNTKDIWIRREFELKDGKLSDPHLLMHHDEDADVYLNGVLAAKTTGYTTDYGIFPMSAAAKAALKPGNNTIAIHCKQTGGGQYIDAGVVDVRPAARE